MTISRIDVNYTLIVSRNLEVRSLDETFWEKAFVSNLESDDLMTSDKKTTLKSTSTPSDRSHGDCSISYPKFLQSILGEVITTGKSMEVSCTEKLQQIFPGRKYQGQGC